MNRHRTLIFAAATLSATLWASSCGDGATEPPPDPPRPTTVTVSPANAELAALAATEQLTARVLDQYGQVMAGAAVTWSSGDASVAAVDASGLVTAAGNGTATITATAGSASGTAAVTVMQRVSMVEVSPPADTVVERDTVRFEAVAVDANGHAVAGAEFMWASGDTSVAVVDASGLVTGTGAGEVEVVATSSGVAGRGELVVEAAVPTAVAVAPDALEFTALGDTARLMAEVRDQIGRVMEGEPVAWTSGDTMVAVVDSTGLVAVVGNGAATITAKAGEAAGEAAVAVMQHIRAVKISPAADTVVEADTLRLSAEAADANGHAVVAEFTWGSGDTLVALVDASGLVTGIGPGQVEITAASSGVAERATITVVTPVATTVAVSPDTLAFTALGRTAQLAGEVRDQAGRVMEGEPVAWASGDTMVAVVDSGGLVTAVGGGASVVTATAGSASGTAAVTVMQRVSMVEVSPPADTVVERDTVRFEAVAVDANGHAVAGAEFAWSSSDVSVATVDASGLVRGVAEGRATIMATAGSVSGTSEIAVENPDRAALVALYHATDGPSWINSDNWLTDAPLGDWYGVDTDGSGRVRRLDLGGEWDNEAQETVPHGLKGPILPELGKLDRLTFLDLSGNNLTGPIPAELGNLARLEDLSLGENALTGPLTGLIPPEFGNLTSLVTLYLDGNALTGPIPSQLASLPNLRYVSFPIGVCVPADLRAWAVELSVSLFLCSSEGPRLLPSALMREDGNGLSLALPDDLREPSAVTVSDPSVATVSIADGWLRLVPRSRGSTEVEVMPSGGGAPASARIVVRAAVGTFGIDIVMDRPAPVSYEKGLTTAADWWSSVLDGTEWPDRRPTCLNRVTALADDLIIHARAQSDLTVHGYAVLCDRRPGVLAALGPGGGRIVARATSANFYLVRHEIGHLLGLVLWGPETGLTTEDRAYFIGPQAVEAFRASGGDPDLSGVPINGVHWGVGVDDFMGYGGGGAISAAALADAGYTVDMTKAGRNNARVGVYHANDVVRVVRSRPRGRPGGPGPPR